MNIIALDIILKELVHFVNHNFIIHILINVQSVYIVYYYTSFYAKTFPN